MQSGLAFGVVPGHPAVRALPRDSQFLGNMGDRATIDTHPLDQQQTPMHGQPGITVGHEDLQGSSEVGKLHSARRSSSDQLPHRRVTNVLSEYS